MAVEFRLGRILTDRAVLSLLLLEKYRIGRILAGWCSPPQLLVQLWLRRILSDRGRFPLHMVVVV